MRSRLSAVPPECERGAVSKVCVGAQDSADNLAEGAQVAVSVQGGDLVSSQPGLLLISSRRALRCSSLRPLFGSKLTSKNRPGALVMAKLASRGVRHEGRGAAQAQLNQVVVVQGTGTDVLPARSGPQPGSGGPGYRTCAHRAGRRSGIPVDREATAIASTPRGIQPEVVEVAAVFAILRLEP